MLDSLIDCRYFRMLTVVDIFSRFSPIIEALSRFNDIYDASITKSKTRFCDRTDPLSQRQVIAKSRHITAGGSAQAEQPEYSPAFGGN